MRTIFLLYTFLFVLGLQVLHIPQACGMYPGEDEKKTTLKKLEDEKKILLAQKEVNDLQANQKREANNLRAKQERENTCKRNKKKFVKRLTCNPEACGEMPPGLVLACYIPTFCCFFDCFCGFCGTCKTY